MERDKTFTFRVSDEEMKLFRDISKKTGKPLAELIREGVKNLDGKYVAENKKLRDLLNKIQEDIEEST